MSLAREQMAWVERIEGEFSHVDLFARYTEIVGLTIKSVNLTGYGDGDGVAIHFTDGRMILITDDGQSCCESRYMTCDDDLSGHEGGNLISIDLNAAGSSRGEDHDEGEYHETQFVRVQTTRGSFTLCTHNVHNGYYGGFDLTVRLEG